MGKLKAKLQNWWNDFQGAMSNPWALITGHKNPIIMVIGIVFIVQPIVSFIIDGVSNIMYIHQQLDPDDRPVTERELKLIDQKIEVLQATLTKISNERHWQQHDLTNVDPQWKALQDQLHDVQHQADKKFLEQKQAKK